MKIIRIILVTALVLSLTTVSLAEEKKWSDQAELSFVDTGGNTETSTLSLKNEFKYKFSEEFDGTWKVGVLNSESDGTKSAESYFTELRGDYLFSDRTYFYLAGGWLKDTFSGIDSRIYIGPGIGYKFFVGPKHYLSGEFGVNYTSEDYTDDTDSQFATGRAFGSYEYIFTETTKFSQDLEFLYDFEESENYQIVSETAVTSSLNSNFSLKAGYTVKFDNLPSSGITDDTDTILAVTLVANY